MDFSQLASAAASFSATATSTWQEDIVATIQNRFGTFDFTDSQLLTLPSGMVGLEEFQSYALAPFPGQDGGLNSFRLLQCLQEAALTFIVYPTMHNNSFLDSNDVRALADMYHVSLDELVLLHVATVRGGEHGQEASMTLNIKAPIVVNAHKQTAVQHVLASNKYSSQMLLSQLRDAA